MRLLVGSHMQSKTPSFSDSRGRLSLHFMKIIRRYGVEIRLFSGRRGAAPYDLTYIIRRHGAENLSFRAINDRPYN